MSYSLYANHCIHVCIFTKTINFFLPCLAFLHMLLYFVCLYVCLQVMKNRYTGHPAGYCFVNFSSDQAALTAMHKLNGKVIPHSQPVSTIRFGNVKQS